MNELKMYECVCDCEACSSMCRSPCCGTVEEIKAIMDAGFADRLMYDTCLDGNEQLIKPALKEHEGEIAPYNTRSLEGCTFWKNGLCELHDLGLKPLGGRIASCHGTLIDQTVKFEKFSEFINADWKPCERVQSVIDEWIKLNPDWDKDESCFD